MTDFDQLYAEIKQCRLCAPHLEHGPNPVLQVNPKAKILIAGQAPGRLVHQSGKPFDDKSGERLRNWLGVDEAQFYDPELFAIVPMGFCFPGTGKSGDLPPRRECGQTWHDKLFEQLDAIQLKLVIGAYAMNYHLGDNQEKTLTGTVMRWQDYLPTSLPLPHPSPRNNIWLRKNQWFEKEVVPALRLRVLDILAGDTI